MLACRDLEATGAWLEGELGLDKGATIAIDYSMINAAFGLPDGTKHSLATLKHGEDVFLEIDTYPAAATPRPQHAGWLPPGVAMASLVHPGFAHAADAACPSGATYAGQPATLLRGPDGARFEIIGLPA